MSKNKEYFSLSPFALDGVVDRPYLTKEGESIVANEDGEAFVLKKIPSSRIVIHDSLQYIKLFTGSCSGLLELSFVGLRVVIYSCLVLPVRRDVVSLNPADVCLMLSISNSSFYRAIDELVDKKIMARKLGSTIEYWINPNVLFNGNRIGLVKTYGSNKFGNMAKAN